VSIFRDLLAIKAFREGQAEAAVRQRRMALQDARAAREAAEALLQRLIREGLTQEMAMYQDLCTRIVRLREIEHVQDCVAALREREVQQQEHADAAAKLQTQAEQALDLARTAHQEASRQKSKFVDLARNHNEAVLRELERKEDLELEEVASATRDREDWESHDTEEFA
jgi:type III secretion protein O